MGVGLTIFLAAICAWFAVACVILLVNLWRQIRSGRGLRWTTCCSERSGGNTDEDRG